ncbi:hypothetical protein CDL15_Pgr009396 [Punica granatum]|uniref:Uncharacterized protein n=1 Tax=Punica granatum TaxID=22663 RepID=A0A218VT27_PUNGR|nr:hypothetical protein CDL15_Pgr009396 [Punica granatum]
MGNQGCPGANVERGCSGLHLLKWLVAVAPCGMGNQGCPGANVERGCPGLHLLKWLVAGVWCDVFDYHLLFFAVRASRRVHAFEAAGCSRKTVA